MTGTFNAPLTLSERARLYVIGILALALACALSAEHYARVPAPPPAPEPAPRVYQFYCPIPRGFGPAGAFSPCSDYLDPKGIDV